MSMQMQRLALMLFCMLPMAALMYGCGSSSKEGSGTPSTVATIGDTACVQCHSAAKDPVTGETIVSQYDKSAHYLAGKGCESCHGGGAQHNGVGPIPYPAPDATRCATCHTETNSTVFQIALTMKGAAEDPTNPSNHANGGYEGIATGEKCYRCHTHEGAVLSNIAGYTGDKTIIDNTSYMLTQDRDFTKFKGIQCATCHEHGGALRLPKTRDASGNVVVWDPNNNRKVDQFDLCTSCHTYQNPNGTLVASGTAASGTKPATAPFYHNTAWYRTIASTHWDNPATATTADGTQIEGYVIKTTGATPCFDCHGHEAKTNTRSGRPSTTHTDWAQSAHAGHILIQKYAAETANPITASRTGDPVNYTLQGQAQLDAVMNANVNDSTGIGWTHYNWDSTYNATTGAVDRGTCQRCHTSTGAANFMTNPATYIADGSGNSFSHLSGWNAKGGSPQQEVLYCWACHTNAGKGTLRNPGAIKETYTAATTGSPATTVQYPDVSGSNVCMSCHLGRETGEVIKNDIDADGVRSFVNSHYLAAGGTLFGTTGYEYAGRDYANPAYFAHDKIGSSAAAGTGTNGPCVGCHMTTPNKHKFTNVTKDSIGKITAITSTACATCHSGNYALTAEKLVDEEHEYLASLEAAKAVLASIGIHYYNTYPYFFTNAYVVGGTNTGFTNWASIYTFAKWKDTMGAAFNLNLLAHDPGGYAHNRYYSKRLIWDAIDFAYDGTLNNDVTTAIDAQVTAGRLTADNATNAKTYLGTSRP